MTGAASGIGRAIAHVLAEAVRFVLRRSPTCLVPEIVFQRPQELP